jgi:hypothetical protein
LLLPFPLSDPAEPFPPVFDQAGGPFDDPEPPAWLFRSLASDEIAAPFSRPVLGVVRA